MMPGRAAHGSSGFVQVLVLVSLASVGAAVTASLGVARVGNEAAAALSWTVETEALARSAFQRMSRAIEDPADDFEVGLMETPGTLMMGRSNVGVSIESEASKIDLMLADLALVRKYATNAGLLGSEAEDLMSAVEAARKEGTRQAALDVVVVALLGKRSYDELSHDFTLYGADGTINPAYATARVLAAVPDLSAADVEVLKATPPAYRAATIRSAFFGGEGARFSLVATVERGADRAQHRLIVEMTAGGRVVPVSGS